MKPDTEKYVVISPDGLPLTHDPFRNKQAALDYIPQFREGLEQQGYYAAVGRRIPLDELAGHLAIVPESEALEEMGKIFKRQTTLDESPLAEIMEKAENYVRVTMSRFGEVPPTLIMVGRHGISGFSRDDLSDEAKKQEFVTTSRMICIAEKVQAAVFCSGGFMRAHKKGEVVALAPDDSLGRDEVVLLVGEEADWNVQRILPVQRSDEDEFLGFGKEREIKGGKVAGEFGHFLAQQAPDEAMRLEAERYLEAKNLRAVNSSREREQGIGRVL